MQRRLRYVLGFIFTFVAAVSFAACGTQPTGDRPQASVEMDLPFTQPVVANGAGASFPAPLYQLWFRNLNNKERRLQFNYQSVGSGAGIERFTQRVVDFGASDIAMTDEQLAAAGRDVLMLPMTAGSIVIPYNLPGVDNLQLSREAYSNIFMGKITRWNDPKIVATNPGVNLPDQPINVMHRSDGSGTTAVFTQHLSAINPEWKQTIGSGTTVEWPTGTGSFVGGRGNEGVTALVTQTPNSIGYVEFNFAKTNNLSVAALENKAGKFVKPTPESGMATLEQVELPENLRAFITDPPGDGSYPLVTYTWMLLNQKYDDPNKAIAMEAMVQYCLTDGQKESPNLGFIKLPASVIQRVAKAADSITPDFTISIPSA